MGRHERGRLLQPDPRDDPLVQQFAQSPGQRGVPAGAGRAAPGLQMLVQPVADQRQPALRLQLVPGPRERGVQVPDPPPQHRVAQVGGVHGRPDQLVAQPGGVQVQDALAEAVRGGRGAVVRHVRRQQRHRVVRGAVLVPVQVVPYGAGVDDEQRPGVVDVHRVGVLGVVGVEDLDDAGDAGPPGGDVPPGPPLVVAPAAHAKNVQDRVGRGSAVSPYEHR